MLRTITSPLHFIKLRSALHPIANIAHPRTQAPILFVSPFIHAHIRISLIKIKFVCSRSGPVQSSLLVQRLLAVCVCVCVYAFAFSFVCVCVFSYIVCIPIIIKYIIVICRFFFPSSSRFIQTNKAQRLQQWLHISSALHFTQLQQRNQ